MEEGRTRSSAEAAETSDKASGDGPPDPASPQAQDIGPHLEAWQDFYRLTKWSTIGVAVVLILLALFLL